MGTSHTAGQTTGRTIRQHQAATTVSRRPGHDTQKVPCTVTGSDHSSAEPSNAKASSAEVAREIAIEQAHVDLVYAELVKAQARAGLSRPTAWPAAAPTAPVTSATRS